MELRRIELDAVGIFDRPVAVTGLGPGLNVLAGPNERGKSTLLNALLTLFLESHRARKETIQRLKPYGGGAPRIACRFSIGTVEWHLEKQYLAAAKAELARADGAERHVGADAETALGELLAGAGDLAACLPLLWVRQGDASKLPVLPEAVRLSLGEVLAAEAEKSSGAGGANAALREVAARLGALVTEGRGQPRRGGAYARCLAERDEVATALGQAEARARQAEAWIARLTALQQEEAELVDPETASRRTREREALERRLAEARHANDQLKALGERMAFLSEQKNQRVRAVEAHDEAVTERAELAARMTAADAEMARIVEEIAGFDTGLAAAALALEEAQAREQAQQEALDSARGAAVRQAEGARREQLIAQRARLAEVETAIAALDAELAAMTWPEDTLERVQEAARELAALELRREAAAPSLTVSYAAGRADGFSIDGADLADGEARAIVDPVSLEAAGIGRLEIRPAMWETRDKLEAEMALWQHRLARHLETMGAATPDAAAAREAERIRQRNRRRLRVMERDTLAPQGAGALEAELVALGPADAAGTGAAAPAREAADEIAAALVAVRDERRRHAAERERLKEARALAESRRAELAAERAMRRSRVGQLESLVNGPAGEAAQRAGLAAVVEDAERLLAEALRGRAAFEDRALPPEAVARLETEIAAVHGVEADRDRRLAEIRQEMRRIEGMLVRDFEDGPGEEVGALGARLEAVSESLADIEQEIAALRLLAEHLGTETERHRREISGPLARRLARLADRIWPDAEVALTPELEVARLARTGREEAPGAISQGTHEQLAVLARLAYADMLKGDGPGVPIILDDPFVYSDDSRLDRLFGVLAEAATRHQIIILTCHARAFEPLVSRHGAARLAFAADASEAASATLVT